MHAAELARALARGLHISGSFCLFGTPLFAAFILPAPARTAVRATLRRITWSSLLVASAAAIAWLLLQSANMASATSLTDAINAIPLVIRSTRFGHLLILRECLLIATACCVQTNYFRTATLLGGVAIAAEAWLGHGAAMSGAIGVILLLSLILHLTAGAAWIGSLPALASTVAKLSLPDAAKITKKYSPLGISCVAAVILTAAIQFTVLISTPSTLLTTNYGRVALFKIALLAALIAVATINRARLAPALLTPRNPQARKTLLLSITVECAIGLTAVLAAGLLLNLAPPTMAAMLSVEQ
jgi:putative copper resistance protein D